MTKRNPEQMAEDRTQGREHSLTGLRRIREAARKDRHQRFTSLMHHITRDLLRDSFLELKRVAAVGVDEQTWHEYAQGLAGRLADLHERVHSGRYKAQPSKRIYILKEDGRKRPIGIATLEDKIVQKAVVKILEQIYEEDFLRTSYGYRPGKKQHDALDAVYVGMIRRRVNYVFDADLSSFFDTIDHEWMMRFLAHRIADRRILRLIKKWLRSGVSEEGEWSPTSTGTPQGAVISPLLANIYLHYVLDLWVQQWRREQARGDVTYVRWADDFVMGFQYHEEAVLFCVALKERLSTFSLSVNESKTRIIEFGRFAEKKRRSRGDRKPETFDFPGFTHICSKTRKTGKFDIRRKPIAKRVRSRLKKINQTLKKNRHKPVPEQGKWLQSVVRGYFNYYAVPGTSDILNAFRRDVCRRWIQALRRRSHKARKLTWEQMEKLAERWIPKVRICHPYPYERLIV